MNVMKSPSYFLSGMAVWLVLASCGKEGFTPPESGGGGTDKEEYTYITVEYNKKNNGVFLGWATAESKSTRIMDNMHRHTPATVAVDAWGGRTDKSPTEITAGKAGYFRTGKVGARHYFVDPDGRPCIIRGTQHIAPAALDENASQEKIAAFASRFPGVAQWAAETSSMLALNGFNYVNYGYKRIERFPAEADQPMRNPSGGRKMAQAENLYLLRTFMWDANKVLGKAFEDGTVNRFALIFEPKFIPYIDSLARTKCPLFAGDAHFLGYYLDNELPFNAYNNNSAIDGIELSHFFNLPDRYAAARQYARDFLAERGKTTAAQISTADRDVFRDSVATVYYRLTSAAVRRHDPDHLILGTRLHDWSKYNERTVRACAKFCDVVTLNYYNRWQPETDFMNNLKSWCGNKPFMVTEFYVKGADASWQGHAYENVEGGGWIVRTQRDRGYFYQNFCLGLLEARNCVGWLHFQYVDNYGSAAVNSNKGLVSAGYEPYENFLTGVKQLNNNVYSLADYFGN